VNEAMASGLPVVVSDAVGCSHDLVKPRWPDLCFPVGNHAKLADALISCLMQPPSQTELNALIERYDVLRTVEAVESLYSSV
jgi:glycosyltransferase involved in cell wall biosynthesis